MSHVDTAPAASTPRAAEGRRPRRVKSQRAKSEARLGWLLAGPAFFVMLFVVLYPILQALYDSLFKYRLTAPGDREFVGLGNYGVILTDPVFWKDLGVTLLITVVTVVVELILGFLLALAMHHAIKQTRGLIRTIILVPYGIITVVSAFAWFYMFSIDSGYINAWFEWLPGVDADLNWFAQGSTALFVIMLSEIWKTTPFISLLLLAGCGQQEGPSVDALSADPSRLHLLKDQCRAGQLDAVGRDDHGTDGDIVGAGECSGLQRQPDQPPHRHRVVHDEDLGLTTLRLCHGVNSFSPMQCQFFLRVNRN